MDQLLLSDMTLAWMISQFAELGLDFDDEYITETFRLHKTTAEKAGTQRPWACGMHLPSLSPSLRSPCRYKKFRPHQHQRNQSYLRVSDFLCKLLLLGHAVSERGNTKLEKDFRHCGPHARSVSTTKSTMKLVSS